MTIMDNRADILNRLADHARERTAAAKLAVSLQDMKKAALDMPKGDFAFEKALRREGLSFILECKKASPSKGIITDDFPYMDIAVQYEAAGADCISVLTEPKWFLGSNDYLRQIASAVKIPCLRKDFTVDEYMIHEAKVLGASAVLLIVSILSDEQLGEYLDICGELGLGAVVETHDEEEAERAVRANASIIGVNNRDLRDFSVDRTNAGKIGRIIPDDRVFVSESGIMTPEDVVAAKDAGADAVLIGEAVMRAPDKKAALKRLRSLL